MSAELLALADENQDVGIAVALFLALAAVGIACALWWRINEMGRQPAAEPTAGSAERLVDEPPTTPIDDAIDRELARFTFDGGRRP